MINRKCITEFFSSASGYEEYSQEEKIYETFAGYTGFLLSVILAFSVCTEKRSGRLQTLGKDEGKVIIAGWPGYVEKGENDSKYDWVSEFEKNNHCKVENIIFKNEHDISRVLQDGTADLVILSSELVLKYARDEKLREKNLDLLPNWANVDSRVRNSSWFKILDKSYGVPIGWSANYLLFNKNYFSVEPDSWELMFEEGKLSDGRSSAKRIQAYGNPVYIADAALYLKYKRPELKIQNIMNLNEVQYKAVIDLLKKQHNLLNSYWTDAVEQIKGFRSGTFIAAPSWPYQYHILRKEGMLNYNKTIPREGVTGWADAILMPEKAKNINCAYKYLNHSLNAKVQGDMAAWTGSVPVVPDACFQKNSLINSQICTENGFFHYDKITFWQSLERCDSFNPCVSFERWQTDFLFLKLGMFEFLP
ncbi:MAG TPA: extracellular solute-binding protein [Leptospiraceae bacterium]|nr:extracellular solute-binding protein [Leptospiraceae bacterium]